MSAMRPSSGFGSAIKSDIEARTVEMLTAGFQSPCPSGSCQLSVSIPRSELEESGVAGRKSKMEEGVRGREGERERGEEGGREVGTERWGRGESERRGGEC
jgi:hypothetical protein